LISYDYDGIFVSIFTLNEKYRSGGVAIAEHQHCKQTPIPPKENKKNVGNK
jgi:hypothetical protein